MRRRRDGLVCRKVQPLRAPLRPELRLVRRTSKRSHREHKTMNTRQTLSSGWLPRLVRLASAWWTIMRWDWRPGHIWRLMVEWVTMAVGAVGYAAGAVLYPLYMLWTLFIVPIIGATRIRDEDVATANRIMAEHRKRKANDKDHPLSGAKPQ